VNWLTSIIIPIILFMPSYIANPSAVIFGGKIIIDGGRKFRGRRIFGDHKTLSGFLGGGFAGFLIGIVIIVIGAYWKPLSYSSSIYVSIVIILLLSFGSMLGDLIGSFIKRQLNFEPGKEALFLDQYPFALVSLFLVYLYLKWDFFRVFPWPGIIAILIITPLLHRAVNIIGFKIKLKDVPY
jgi:Cytidylyltransferase family.